MKVTRTIDETRAALQATRDAGDRIGLVPTMGAFHEGHLSLIRAARAESDRVVVSLFVNPTQFGADEDLGRYPRDEARDAALAEAEGADLLFAPSADEIYPPGFTTWIDVGELGEILEGAARPGHFKGVATVCCKLFEIVRPAQAYFGRKDAQQVAVVKQVVRDLNLGLVIRAMPTVRDADGLALSSRNRYLSSEERQEALKLPRALAAGLEAYRGGRDAVSVACELLTGVDVDYVTIADLDGPTLAAAVRIGSVRLIDNLRLEEEAA
ncbi:MAG: pantoate--beta-alanine ligase [Chloroflexota bacterium]|nr:pantoate--beta-alanine ligase [Chloroflexota bacterium]